MVLIVVIISYSIRLFLGNARAEYLPSLESIIWETGLKNYKTNAYNEAVENLFKAYESAKGKKILPQKHKKVALKVCAAAQKGLSTPLNLVRAVITCLEKRGYVRKDITIVGRSQLELRQAGFLPPLSKRGGLFFEGTPVVALENDKNWHEKWFYTNPLPSKEFTFIPFHRQNDRKSFLPVFLLFEVDFWINLPIITSHPATGLTGALVNGTLLNISNNRRFFFNPAQACVAISEISAIPELRRTWLLNIVSFERYQVIGGFKFNALYTVSDPKVWLSLNPALIDFQMFRRINFCRSRFHLPQLVEEPKYFYYFKLLNKLDYDEPVFVKI